MRFFHLVLSLLTHFETNFDQKQNYDTRKRSKVKSKTADQKLIKIINDHTVNYNFALLEA